MVDNDKLEKALRDLATGQEHLSKASAEEAAAEREVAKAIDEVKEAEQEREEAKIHVVHVNDVKRATFEEHLGSTLQHTWTESYGALKIERKAKDIFQTDSKEPVSLMSHLGLTLKQARERKIIVDFRFGIVSETGGA